MKLTKLVCGAVSGAVLAATPALAADPVADFYKGKEITMLIGSGTGGGYDTYARLITSKIGKFIPGNPSLVPRNKNGAGSIIAINYAVNVLPKDGTVIIGLQRNAALVQIMGKRGRSSKPPSLTGSVAWRPSQASVLY